MIFNLFKAKPTLKELIPDGFVDIHSHILPGIDDGAKNIKEAKNLINEMKNLGFSKLIATPHTYEGLYDNCVDSITKSYLSLIQKIDGDKIKFASEYIINRRLIEFAEEKILLTLKDNLVLVEMSYIDKPLDLYDIIFKLQINNYIPVLAHPERYRFLHEDKKQYSKLKKAGCKFQLNLLSTTGYYGADIVKICNFLLNKNYIDFCGSDIHNKNHISKFSSKIKIKDFEKFERIMQNNIDFI